MATREETALSRRQRAWSMAGFAGTLCAKMTSLHTGLERSRQPQPILIGPSRTLDSGYKWLEHVAAMSDLVRAYSAARLASR